jgi:hypothetical protein
VEATWVRPCNWPRRDAAGWGEDAGVVPDPAELEADVDEQAVAARPRPIMAVRILARLRGFTVLPFRKASAFHVQLAASRPADVRIGQSAIAARGPDLENEHAVGAVHFF